MSRAARSLFGRLTDVMCRGLLRRSVENTENELSCTITGTHLTTTDAWQSIVSRITLTAASSLETLVRGAMASHSHLPTTSFTIQTRTILNIEHKVRTEYTVLVNGRPVSPTLILLFDGASMSVFFAPSGASGLSLPRSSDPRTHGESGSATNFDAFAFLDGTIRAKTEDPK